jgi:hypothetical protein
VPIAAQRCPQSSFFSEALRTILLCWASTMNSRNCLASTFAFFGYTIPTLVDSEELAVNDYRVSGWPTTILIDQHYKVV